MKKKKLTNKEITEALGGLNSNDQILWKEIIEIKQMFSLYLTYRNKTFKEELEGFNKFVKAEIEEFEKQQRSELKKGA